MSIYAIIPVRGGSKRLPRKNILPLCGKELLIYTIEAVYDSKMFSRIYVSTEDLEIKQVAGEAGAIVIDRPVELAGDEVSTEDVVDHAFEYFKNEGEYPVYFSVLQATSPLRTGKHIEECIKGFVHEVYCNSAVSVYLNNGELRYNGAIYVTRTNSYLNLKPGKRELVIDPVFFYHMSIKESVDIDTPEDFAKAGEYLTKRG